jgi:hypothetical protein
VADKQFIDALVATGLSHDEATWAADRVFGTIRTLLADGKTVGIPEVCRLRAPRKRIWVAGSCKRKAVEQCKVSMMHPATVWQGEPYDVAAPINRQVASYEMARAAAAAASENR